MTIATYRSVLNGHCHANVAVRFNSNDNGRTWKFIGEVVAPVNWLRGGNKFGFRLTESVKRIKASSSKTSIISRKCKLLLFSKTLPHIRYVKVLNLLNCKFKRYILATGRGNADSDKFLVVIATAQQPVILC